MPIPIRTFTAPDWLNARPGSFVTEYADGRYVVHPASYIPAAIDEDDVQRDAALRHLHLHEIETVARTDDEVVGRLRRQLERAQQAAQRSTAHALKLAGKTATAFLARPWLRTQDLVEAKGQIPRGSIQCAQWDDDGPTVRLGLQLGDDGPGLWLEVARAELGRYAREHDADTHEATNWRERLSAARDQCVRYREGLLEALAQLDRVAALSGQAAARRIILEVLEREADDRPPAVRESDGEHV